MINRSRYLPLSWRGFAFTPFEVHDEGTPIASSQLQPDTELIVFSRGGLRRALVAQEMAYHHVAQGELAGQPYLISF